MRALNLNFTARPGTHVLLKSLLLAAVAACLLALWQREQLLVRIEAEQAEVRRLESLVNDRQFRQATAVQEAPAAQAVARQLILELQQPWEPMLDALQKATKDDVLITRLQPEAGASRLLVSGQADSSEAFLSFAERLRRQTQWRHVEPLGQERTVGNGAGGNPVAFQLALEWKTS